MKFTLIKSFPKKLQAKTNAKERNPEGKRQKKRKQKGQFYIFKIQVILCNKIKIQP